MKIIAHRANINGPSSKYENTIYNINKCIKLGFDVEIDIRVINGKLYLGHDKATQMIEEKELNKFKEHSWIHCKNLEAITFFSNNIIKFNYFWHENDSYTLTSKGYIWAYPGQKLSNSCICVMPEVKHSLKEFSYLQEMQIAGICTDYPNLFR